MLNVDIKNIVLIDNKAGRELLNNIMFTIVENKIYTVLGKNGSGKSTLIKSLTGLLNKEIYTTAGNVFWFDENIFEMSYARLLELRKKEIKYVLQDLTNNFDPLKKLKYYFENSGIDLNSFTINLNEFLLPDYSTISNLHSYEISGGMAQRLSLMLAIISNPKLLILDEPTSAIDYINMNLIKIKLQEFKNAGGSALIVTQDINFAKEISDELAFLYDNRLSEFTESDLFFKECEQKPYGDFLQSFSELQ
jgi:ABC-type dipeptide/oligopeptide/nickel transport system ATPase component